MRNQRAIRFILDTIGKIDNSISHEFVESSSNEYLYKFNAHIGGETCTFEFGRDRMDDLEAALDNTLSSNYLDLANNVCFQIYIHMGEKGIIPHFDIVNELLNEKLNWQQENRVRTQFDERTTQIILGGLKRLSTFLDEIIKKHNILDSELSNDKETIDGYIEYYHKEGHLTSNGVTVRTRSFLKAAVVVEVIALQAEKKQITLSRILKEKDKQLYSLVALLGRPPFYKIQLPECVKEYALHKDGRDDNTTLHKEVKVSDVASKDTQKSKIFLSHSHKDKKFVEQLAKDLIRAEIDVWYADWELEIGHSLTVKIQEGIETSQFLAIVLSPEAVVSTWVEKEWTAAFKKELESRKVVILPILYQDCKIPLLLKDKKYADFRNSSDYRAKLEDLIRQLKGQTVKEIVRASLQENYPHVVRASFQGQVQIRKGNELEIYNWLGSPQGEPSIRIGKMRDLTDEIEYHHSFGMMTIVPVQVTFCGRVRGNIVKQGNSTTEFDLEMSDEEYQKYIPHKEAKKSPQVR